MKVYIEFDNVVQWSACRSPDFAFATLIPGKCPDNIAGEAIIYPQIQGLEHR